MRTHLIILMTATVAAVCSFAAAQSATLPASAPAATGPASSQPDGRLLGCWKRTDDAQEMLRFEAGRVVMASHGWTGILRVVSYEPGKVTLITMGAKVEMNYSLKEEDGKKVLTIVDQKIATYSPMADVPESLDPRPLVLGKSEKLSEKRIDQIQADIASRTKKDQDVRKPPVNVEALRKVDSENTAWLKKVVAEIGWIDADRFGADTAGGAFLLTQHSSDLPLMTAALPEIFKDVKNKKLDAQGYAMLYDRLQLMIGEKQRYGTQIGRNEKGELTVMPLEAPGDVEARRKELGLIPLKDYLAQFKQQNGGKDLDVPKE